MAISFGQRTAAAVVGRTDSLGIAVVGDSGTGKSRTAALAGKRPLIVSYERQGQSTILQWNPDAIVISAFEDDADGTWTGKPFTPITSPRIRNLILKAVLSAIEAGSPEVDDEGKRWWSIPGIEYNRQQESVTFTADRVWIDAFALDSGTEWSRVELEKLLGWSVGDDFDEGNLPRDVYNKLQTNTINLMRRFRTLPIPWVVLFLADEREGDNYRKVFPMLIGKKTAPTIPQFCNAVGLMTKKMREDGLEFGCCFEMPSELAITKSCSGLQPYEALPLNPEEGSPAIWFERISKAQPGTDAKIKPEAKAKLDEILLSKKKRRISTTSLATTTTTADGSSEEAATPGGGIKSRRRKK